MTNASRPRRILIPVSFSHFGGAQIAALRLARGFRERGYEPRVVFLYEQEPIEAPDHPYEVLLRTDRPGILGFLSIARLLFSLMRRERPDVVLSFMPLASLLGQGIALLLGVQRRIISHRVPVNTIRPLFRVLDTLSAWAGVYTGVVAVSYGVLESIRHYPQWLLRSTVVIHNGIRGWTPSRLSRRDARARLGIADSTTVLVAVGRLAPQKNYFLMLKIMEHLQDAMLLVAGDGALRPALERQVANGGLEGKVRFLGSVPRKDVPDILVAADMFIQTSTFEGQSNSVLEALQAGLPLVVHDVPEQRETIAEGEGLVAGALVPLNDVSAWLAAIEELRANPELHEEACSLALRRAATFTYESMIDKFERTIFA